MSKNLQKFFKKFQIIFRNILKFFFRTFLNIHYFSIGFSKCNNAPRDFLRVWTKSAICRKFMRKFSNISKRFHKKIAKMHYLRRFSQNLRNLAFIFCAFGRIRQASGTSRNFSKIFEKVLKKIAKNALF